MQLQVSQLAVAPAVPRYRHPCTHGNRVNTPAAAPWAKRWEMPARAGEAGQWRGQPYLLRQLGLQRRVAGFEHGPALAASRGARGRRLQGARGRAVDPEVVLRVAAGLPRADGRWQRPCWALGDSGPPARAPWRASSVGRPCSAMRGQHAMWAAQQRLRAPGAGPNQAAMQGQAQACKPSL